MKRKERTKSNEVGKKETEELQRLVEVLQGHGMHFGNELTKVLAHMTNDLEGTIVATIAMARAMAFLTTIAPLHGQGFDVLFQSEYDHCRKMSGECIQSQIEKLKIEN